MFKLYDAYGKLVVSSTLADVAKEANRPLLPLVEALAVRNYYLQDIPWEAKISPVLDAKGRPYLRVIKGG